MGSTLSLSSLTTDPNFQASFSFESEVLSLHQEAYELAGSLFLPALILLTAFVAVFFIPLAYLPSFHAFSKSKSRNECTRDLPEGSSECANPGHSAEDLSPGIREHEKSAKGLPVVEIPLRSLSSPSLPSLPTRTPSPKSLSTSHSPSTKELRVEPAPNKAAEIEAVTSPSASFVGPTASPLKAEIRVEETTASPSAKTDIKAEDWTMEKEENLTTMNSSCALNTTEGKQEKRVESASDATSGQDNTVETKRPDVVEDEEKKPAEVEKIPAKAIPSLDISQPLQPSVSTLPHMASDGENTPVKPALSPLLQAPAPTSCQSDPQKTIVGIKEGKIEEKAAQVPLLQVPRTSHVLGLGMGMGMGMVLGNASRHNCQRGDSRHRSHSSGYDVRSPRSPFSAGSISGATTPNSSRSARRRRRRLKHKLYLRSLNRDHRSRSPSVPAGSPSANSRSPRTPYTPLLDLMEGGNHLANKRDLCLSERALGTHNSLKVENKIWNWNPSLEGCKHPSSVPNSNPNSSATTPRPGPTARHMFKSLQEASLTRMVSPLEYTQAILLAKETNDIQTAIEVFNRLASLNSGPLPVPAIDATVSCWERSGNMDMGVKIIRDIIENKAAPRPLTCELIMSRLMKSGCSSSALEVFQMAGRAGTPRDEGMYRLALKAATDNWQTAMRLFEEMFAVGIEPSAETYSTMIQITYKQDQWRTVVQLFDEMHLANCEPNACSYKLAISACLRLYDTKKAKTLLERAVSSSVALTPAFFTATICAAEKAQNAPLALQLLTLMENTLSSTPRSPNVKPNESNNLKPNSNSLKSPRTPLSKRSSSPRSQNRFGDGEHGHPLFNEIPYNATISALRRAGDLNGALKVLNRMKKLKVLPDTVTYNTLLAACERAGAKNKALQLFQQMQQEQKTNPRAGPDTITFNSLISCCGRAGDWKLGLSLLDDMKRGGYTPDEITFTSAITACGKANQWEKALALFGEMERIGLPCSVVSYTATISACERAGRWREALEVFASMKADPRVKANVLSYTTAIGACAQARRWKDALDLLEEMEVSGVMANQLTYAMAIRACVRANKIQKAVALGSRMESIGIRHGTLSFSELINAYAEGGDANKALSLYASMREQKISPNRRVFAAVLSAAQRIGRQDVIASVARDIKAMGIKGFHHPAIAGHVSGFGGSRRSQGFQGQNYKSTRAYQYGNRDHLDGDRSGYQSNPGRNRAHRGGGSHGRHRAGRVPTRGGMNRSWRRQ